MLLPTSHPHPLPSLPTSHLSPTTLTPHLPLFHQPHSPPSTHHLPPSLHTSHSSPPTLHPPPSLLQDEQPVKTLDLTTAVECCRDWTYSKDHGFRYVATFTHRYWHWCGSLSVRCTIRSSPSLSVVCVHFGTGWPFPTVFTTSMPQLKRRSMTGWSFCSGSW